MICRLHNARYYDPSIGRFTSPDTIIQDLWDPQTLNSYTYCLNNPLKYVDPTGHIVWVPILIGIAIGAAFYTGGVAIDNAINDQPLMQGWDPWDCAMWAGLGGLSGGILGNVGLGASFGVRAAIALTVNVSEAEIGYGISGGRKGEWTAEGAALTGVTAAGFTFVGAGVSAVAGRLSRGVPTSTIDDLTGAANRANAKVGSGSGRFHGTRVHTAFEAEVNALGRGDLTTEVSYLRGNWVRRGTPGSVRIDVVEGPLLRPTGLYDLKTGAAGLSPARIHQIQQHVPGGSWANVQVIR